MAAAYLLDFECYKRRFLRTTFVSSIWHNAYDSSVIPSLPENFGWNLVDRKCEIQWFKGDVCPTSIESVSINYNEEEKGDNESESDSNIF